MAMKKAEMEEHEALYGMLLAEAQGAEKEGRHGVAVKKALEAWQHIDGMMQYERRYEQREFKTVNAIELVLRYAPLLLDFESLDHLESLLAGTRRIEKNTTASLAAKLERARQQLRDAHRLYDHVETNPGCREDELRRALGGKKSVWSGIAEGWDRMGIVRRTPKGGSYELALTTRMGEVVGAMCSACGHRADGPKAMFLDDLTCPNCGQHVGFVLLANDTSEAAEI